MEPYLKGWDLDKKTLEKYKLNANFFCQQLGEYHMPFAWTAINVLDIISGNQTGGGASGGGGSAAEGGGWTPLIRKDRDGTLERKQDGTPEPLRRREGRAPSVSSTGK